MWPFSDTEEMQTTGTEEALKDMEWFCERGTTGWLTVNGCSDVMYASYDTDAKILRVALDDKFQNCTNIVTAVHSVLVRNPEFIKMSEG